MRSPHGYNWDAPWLECRRKWAWENIWGYYPQGGARPFAMGSAIHEGLEAWYFPTTDSQGTRQIEAIARARSRMQKEAGLHENLQEYLQDDLMMIESLLSGYFARYPTELFRVIGKPEKEFCVCLICQHMRDDHTPYKDDDGDPQWGYCTHPGCQCKALMPYTGKIDLPVEQDGQALVIEHKSSGLDAGSFIKLYHLSDQITGYVWGARILHPKVAGALLNGLGKGRIAKTLSKANHWYARETFIRTERDIERWRAMRIEMRYEREGLIQRWKAMGSPGPAEDSVFYMNTESCRHWNRDCPMLDACLYHGDPHILSTFYSRERKEVSEDGA